MKWIVAGLGNPDPEHENTRHNVGWMVLGAWIEGEWEYSKNAKAHYVQISLGREKVELIKPSTYMNRSGEAVGYAVKKHKIKPEHVIVVHDDMDLPFGKMKISFGRGSAGHKGVESIRKALKTNEFVRVRIGVSRATSKGKVKKPVGEDKVIKFVLGKFSPAEQKDLKKVLKRSVEALETIIKEGRAKAMNEFN